MDTDIALLLQLIDQAYDRKSWHGTNLKGSIRGVDRRAASWRPGKGRHNIWEIVVHAAYWKYLVRRRLLGEKRGSFPLKGSNWIIRPGNAGSSGLSWKADRALLGETHQKLREAVALLASTNLDTVPEGSKVSNRILLTGIASHDLYHAGQIQLLKKLTVRPSR